MTRRLPRIAMLAALVLAGSAVPAVAQQSSQTGGASPSSGPTAPITPGGLRGGMATWSGTIQGASSVEVQQLDQASGQWSDLAQAPVASDGTFTASWLANDAIGSYTVRAVPADGSQQQASTADAPPTARVTVFRPVKATWYGPGFYGKKTACGQKLTHALAGVAHKKLPCGTPVQIFYKGRSITVPVVDRGPFANGASYDLTSAAAQALGMTETDRIGVVPQTTSSAAKASPKSSR